MSIDRYLLTQLQASAAGEGPMALCARNTLAEVERMLAETSTAPSTLSTLARETSPTGEKGPTMSDYNSFKKSYDALESAIAKCGAGPAVALARSILAGAQTSSAPYAARQRMCDNALRELKASGSKEPDVHVSRHSAHAGMLDEAFGLSPNRGPRHEGSRTILSPRR